MRIENVSMWAVRQKTSHVGRDVMLVGIGEEKGGNTEEALLGCDFAMEKCSARVFCVH